MGFSRTTNKQSVTNHIDSMVYSKVETQVIILEIERVKPFSHIWIQVISFFLN